MVYLFTLRQKSGITPMLSKDAYAYLRNHAFLHALSPGLLLVAPTCHIFNLRKGLAPYLRPDDELDIHPITRNDYTDPPARGFVEFWLHTTDHAPPYTVDELKTQYDG